jgi:hypothetical protein
VFYVFKWLSALFRHEKSHLFKARNNEVEVVCTIPKGEIEHSQVAWQKAYENEIEESFGAHQKLLLL